MRLSAANSQFFRWTTIVLFSAVLLAVGVVSRCTAEEPIATIAVISNPYITTLPPDQIKDEQGSLRDFLAELVDKECQTRTQSRIVRLMRNANLLAGKTWDGFDWSRLPLHVTQQFETLRQGDFLNRQDNLLIFE